MNLIVYFFMALLLYRPQEIILSDCGVSGQLACSYGLLCPCLYISGLDIATNKRSPSSSPHPSHPNTTFIPSSSPLISHSSPSSHEGGMRVGGILRTHPSLVPLISPSPSLLHTTPTPPPSSPPSSPSIPHHPPHIPHASPPHLPIPMSRIPPSAHDPITPITPSSHPPLYNQSPIAIDMI